MHGGGPASRWRRRLCSLVLCLRVKVKAKNLLRNVIPVAPAKYFMGPRWFAEKAATREAHANECMPLAEVS